MEASYASTIALIRSALSSSPHERILVAVSGPPGSGKTTIATHLIDLLNRESSSQKAAPGREKSPLAHAISVSVDGFHYTRAQLSSFPNAAEAHIRRGAPWTFDVDAILQLVQSLYHSAAVAVAARTIVKAPSFDHAVKDPVEDDIEIGVETNIIILEGNYLLLDVDKWRDISRCMDVKVFVDVDVDCARNRVARRHVAAGIEETYDKAWVRFDANDALNGDLIRKNRVQHDVRIESVNTL